MYSMLLVMCRLHIILTECESVIHKWLTKIKDCLADCVVSCDGAGCWQELRNAYGHDFFTAEQHNKDIPDQVQVMTYKMTELEKTLSAMSAAQIPRLQENITVVFSHVCSM